MQLAEGGDAFFWAALSRVPGFNDYLGAKRLRGGRDSREAVLKIIAFIARGGKDGVRRRDLIHEFLYVPKEVRALVHHEATIQRILDDLIEIGLVVKEERVEPTKRSKLDKNKPSSYYRLDYIIFATPFEEPKEDVTFRRDKELAAAKALLAKYYNNPQAEIDHWIKEHDKIICEPTGEYFTLAIPDVDDEERKRNPVHSEPFYIRDDSTGDTWVFNPKISSKDSLKIQPGPCKSWPPHESEYPQSND